MTLNGRSPKIRPMTQPRSPKPLIDRVAQLPVARTSNEQTIKPPTNPITFVFTLTNAKYQESVRYDASRVV
jgi:hypothetical protein